MNRYLLDTNILGYLFGDVDCLSPKVYDILNDVESLLYTNTICVGELIHLVKTKKLRYPRT